MSSTPVVVTFRYCTRQVPNMTAYKNISKGLASLPTEDPPPTCTCRVPPRGCGTQSSRNHGSSKDNDQGGDSGMAVHLKGKAAGPQGVAGVRSCVPGSPEQADTAERSGRWSHLQTQRSSDHRCEAGSHGEGDRESDTCSR